MFPATADETITRSHFGNSMTIEELTTMEKLNNAFYKASVESKWKCATQRYHSNLLINNLELQKDLRNGTYQIQPTINFWIRERGKDRYIESLLLNSLQN